MAPRLEHLRHRVLSRIKPYSKLGKWLSAKAAVFANTATTVSNVTVVANSTTFTKTAHGLTAGLGPFGVVTGNGISNADTYFVQTYTANTFTLATSMDNPPVKGLANGTVSIARTTDTEAVLEATKRNGSAKVDAATDIDALR